MILFIIATIGFFTFAFSKERHPERLAPNPLRGNSHIYLDTFYWAISINTNLNIGIRHLIPVYGGTAILVAGQLSVLYEHVKAKKTYLAFVGVMCAWLLAETIMVFPYYLTYFNEFAGGPSGGHRHVVDSNLDWGQDLKRLADWVDANNIKKISLDYFGWADPSYYLGDKAVWIRNGRYTNAGEFVRDNPDGGYIAVSVTFYQQSIATDKITAGLRNIHRSLSSATLSFVWHIK